MRLINREHRLTTSRDITTRPAGDAQDCLFLSMLPGEIRNDIYRLVLVSSKPIIIYPATIRGQRSLLQTCRQIRSEASRIYYGENTFSIDSAIGDFSNITKFLYAKDGSIGDMISKFTIFHAPEGTQMSQIFNMLHGDPAVSPSATKELRRMVMKSARAAAHRLLFAGIPLHAITVVQAHKCWPDWTDHIVRQMRDMFDAALRAVVKEYDDL